MKIHALRRKLVGVGGESLDIVIGLFASQELLDEAGAIDATRLTLLAESVVVLQDGTQLPFKRVLVEFGLRHVGQEPMGLEVKESNLVAPQSRIVLAR